MIGALDSLGVPTLRPHYRVPDSRTPNTFELIPFRNIVLRHVDEQTLTRKDSYDTEFLPDLQEFRKQVEEFLGRNQENEAHDLFALKLPLASICLPDICAVFDTRLVFIHRPLDEVEATRQRRCWRPVFGSLGARQINGRILCDVVEHKLSFISISYRDLVSNTSQSLDSIIDYCGIGHLKGNILAAKTFIRPPQSCS